MVETSRNQLGALRGWIADRAPDLIKSNEGGSNQVLFRPPWTVVEERQLTLAVVPERRKLQWLRLAQPGGASVCVANLHATANKPGRAADEVRRAAEHALEWAAGRPLLLGGDLNVRPAEEPGLYEELASTGFSAPTGETVIDHLLAHGMTVAEPARQLPAERREVQAGDATRVRLSDHAVVVAAFNMG